MSDDAKPSRREHWDGVHQAKSAEEVSWFQPQAKVSLELIASLGLASSARIIDVGGGVSRLVDGLLARGFGAVRVLDVSARALDHARARLEERAGSVDWVVGDVLQVDLGGPFDLWHDRAVFHFLTEPADRARYAERLLASLVPGGHAVVATFAEDGPIRCSGLPVVRYSPTTLHRELGENALELVAERRDAHVTPQGKEQRFQYSVLRRRVAATEP
ncbi:MAG: class I SAM-dependent methyltransferase [Deltaproteobacteria bacterium]|jgi:SAM-dependent methyltransferase|nr:class I SAM-dependent methyltransferase [Deltaproteobacteria bacterium]MBW2531623.1 class I SAM-dependent methyltransferase [Deltaproteobacteria bacterium]